MKKHIKVIASSFISFLLLIGIPVANQIYGNIKREQLVSKKIIQQINLDIVDKNSARLLELGYEYKKTIEGQTFLYLSGSKSHSGVGISIRKDLTNENLTYKKKLPNSEIRYDFFGYYDSYDWIWEKQYARFAICNEKIAILMGPGAPSGNWEQDLLDIMEAVKEE